MDTKITIEEYVAASKVLEQYHIQVKEKIEKINSIEPTNKTTLRSWYGRNHCSPRLMTALNYIFSNTEIYNVHYIEDIERETFLKVRGSGYKTWLEFERLSKYEL